MNKFWRHAAYAGSFLMIAGIANADTSDGTVRPDSAATGGASELGEVIVTGTRQTNLTVESSPAPIQVIDAQQLKSISGSSDLITTLSKLIPSLTSQTFGGDQSNNALQAKLRGLSPNDTLILINGKRRHTTSSLSISTGPYQGGAGTDLNFIPVDAIDHIEVLTEGAAAQYGSDAIAGVINIILKSDAHGGNVGTTYGKYEDGGGVTDDYTANVGFEPLTNGFLNLTGEVRNHGHSDRGGIDGRTLAPNVTYPNSNWVNVPGYPHLNLIEGDAQYNLKIFTANAGFDLGGGTQLYAFGSYGGRTGESIENYRAPNTIVYPSSGVFVNPSITNPVKYGFPLGFTPVEASDQNDYDATLGIKGDLAGWHWDLSSSYGNNRDKVYTKNSANEGIFGGYSVSDAVTGAVTNVLGTDSTPINFYDGFFEATQWTSNLDVSRDFDVGLAAPLTGAVGGEYRRNTFRIGAGDPASYVGSGAQSYPGFLPVDAGSHGRDNYAAYLDFATRPVDALLADIAGRYERYSDFGGKTVGKLTLRYDVAPAFAVRGTASTGFRAPTLAEEYYTTTNVSPDSATVQLQPNSKASADLGLGNLRPETSTNFSVGFVFKPLPTLVSTLDLYQVTIHNRIVSTGTLNSVVNGTPVGTVGANGLNAIAQAILDSGNQSPAQIVPGGSYAVTLFTNGVDTRTRGADFTLDLPVDYAVAKVDWSVGATYNDTVVTSVRGNPAALAGSPLFATGSSLFDQAAISDLTSASPRYVINLGANATVGKLSVNLREQIYGPSSEFESNAGHSVAIPNGSVVTYIDNHIGLSPITNLDVSYEILSGLSLSAGANNVFNRYPNKVNSALRDGFAAAFNRSTVGIYPGFSPYGFDGGFYYFRATYRFL
jgi:iron complex outermembrane recepter protein